MSFSRNQTLSGKKFSLTWNSDGTRWLQVAVIDATGASVNTHMFSISADGTTITDQQTGLSFVPTFSALLATAMTNIDNKIDQLVTFLESGKL